MAEFQTIAKVGEIPEGEAKAFALNDKMVAVFNLGSKYLAISDTCLHMGASLSTGYVEDEVVMCPWHAWRFCLNEGTWLDNPKTKVDSYEVRVEGDEIQVMLKDVKPEEESTSPSDVEPESTS